MNLILLTGSVTAGWSLLHSNSIVLKHVPDVGAYCPQALVRTAANISFLVSHAVCSIFFLILAFSDVIYLSKLSPLHLEDLSWCLWSQLSHSSICPLSHSVISRFTSVLCHIHRNLPLAGQKNHLRAFGKLITNWQVVGWTMRLTEDGCPLETSN